ncbi:MAG: FmdB family transcriptional regulator [Actinomycetota bacterium]|nr:FmdB family transcriptional regulator [Actinomycetota bacterium]
MPTYSYRCTECDTAFDIQQAFTDDALTECPTCNGRLRKVYNSIGVTFNGSGFYRTDSRTPAKTEGAGSSSGSGSDSGSSSSSSTPESKPASTPAPAKKESAPAKAAS